MSTWCLKRVPPSTHHSISVPDRATLPSIKCHTFVRKHHYICARVTTVFRALLAVVVVQRHAVCHCNLDFFFKREFISVAFRSSCKAKSWNHNRVQNPAIGFLVKIQTKVMQTFLSSKFFTIPNSSVGLKCSPAPLHAFLWRSTDRIRVQRNRRVADASNYLQTSAFSFASLLMLCINMRALVSKNAPLHQRKNWDTGWGVIGNWGGMIWSSNLGVKLLFLLISGVKLFFVGVGQNILYLTIYWIRAVVHFLRFDAYSFFECIDLRTSAGQAAVLPIAWAVTDSTCLLLLWGEEPQGHRIKPLITQHKQNKRHINKSKQT